MPIPHVVSAAFADGGLVRAQEVLWRPPTVDEFDGGQVEWELLEGADTGWKRFQEVIETARVQGPGTRPQVLAEVAQTQPMGSLPNPTHLQLGLADPTRRFKYRYWDGNVWTDHVAAGGNKGSTPSTDNAFEPQRRHPHAPSAGGHREAQSRRSTRALC